MKHRIPRFAEQSPWSPREVELLEATLRLLQRHGYDRLTIDAVAAAARASKATVYRRWPSKAEMVLAAFIEGVCHDAEPIDTGTLRGDLLQVGQLVCQHVRRHGDTIRALMMEISRNRALSNAFRHQFLDKREAMMHAILKQAVQRGEIDEATFDEELWDLLPGYLIFRSIISGRPPTRETVESLVDGVMIPSLTRATG